MTLTRTLLASTAISLSSLGFSYAAPLGKPQMPDLARSVGMPQMIQVQMSVSDAQGILDAALRRRAEAEAADGNIAAAQAEVEAAEAMLRDAQAGAAQPAEPEPEPQPVPQLQPEPEQSAGESPEQDSPQAVEEQPEQSLAPAAEVPAQTEVAPSVELPVEEPAPDAVEAPAEPEPAATEAPVAADPAVEAPVTEQNSEMEAQPAETAPAAPEPQVEAEIEAETQAEAPVEGESQTVEPTTPGEAAPEAEAPVAEDAVPDAGPAPAASDAPEAAPQSEAPEAVRTPVPEPAPAQSEEPATPEPATDTDASAADDAVTETAPEAEADSAATTEPEEVLTLPVKDGAPVLDSAKEESADPAQTDGQAAPAAAVDEPAAPPPASDAEAQAPASRSAGAPEAAMSERGERIRQAPEREAQTNVTIVNQIDNRTIIEVDNRTVIEHDERDRLRAGSEEVYYEQLRGGRVREVIVRPNGVQLVTITNRWGDVVQRSRVMPDGHEYVLFYAEANSDGSREAFVDPGRNLPPLRLGIPVTDYILDATDAEPSAYLEFLLEPPVEQVERLYSVEEVRRSARIRDKVRRVDMDSLTFEFGKATIAEDQIQRLSDVADAMTEILDANPAETFLIEGHTDAVGRDESNLLLSDKRAETIAVALSEVFGIPPENLVTQGYGERYLKVRTEAPERLNRRVTIRRITPLVTPVASR